MLAAKGRWFVCEQLVRPSLGFSHGLQHQGPLESYLKYDNAVPGPRSESTRGVTFKLHSWEAESQTPLRLFTIAPEQWNLHPYPLIKQKAKTPAPHPSHELIVYTSL